jgi:hypothetical protein
LSSRERSVFSSLEEGEGVRYGRRVRERVRKECGFSSLVKQKKKGKIALSFASPEKEN